MKKIFYLFLISVFATSCATSKLTTKSTNAKLHEIEASYNGMVSKPLMVDVDVENSRKEVTYNGQLNLPLKDLKSNAKQLFLETHSCEYVVDPIYSITVVKENNKNKEITIKVTGFAAKYTNIYQVDSLPKSIGQFYALQKPVDRVSYINEITEINPKIGAELSYGSFGHFGLQIDYPFAKNFLRGYAAFESYSSLAENVSFDYDIEFNSVTNQVTAAMPSKMSTASIGLMKEFSVINRVKLRGQAGLNFSLYSDIDNMIIESTSRLGIRLGAAIDVKIYKGISAIFKGYSNLDFVNIHSKNKDFADYNVTAFKADLPSFYLSGGLRFLF